MRHNRMTALLSYMATTLRERATELRRNPDRGSHAVEYAIGIGLAAGAALAVFGAYKLGVANIIKTWLFS
jgi:hypothetical protein